MRRSLDTWKFVDPDDPSTLSSAQQTHFRNIVDAARKIIQTQIVDRELNQVQGRPSYEIARARFDGAVSDFARALAADYLQQTTANFVAQAIAQAETETGRKPLSLTSSE